MRPTPEDPPVLNAAIANGTDIIIRDAKHFLRPELDRPTTMTIGQFWLIAQIQKLQNSKAYTDFAFVSLLFRIPDQCYRLYRSMEIFQRVLSGLNGFEDFESMLSGSDKNQRRQICRSGSGERV